MSESGQVMIRTGQTIPGHLAGSRTTGGLWPHGVASRRAGVVETALLGAGYLAVYVLFEWISTIEHNPFATYSWNPNSGASFAAIVIFGPRMLPFLFVAPLLGDLAVPQFPLPLSFEFAATVLIGGTYGAAGIFLLHPVRNFDRTLQSMSSLILLTFT